MVAISPEGKITDVNEALVKATGVERPSLISTDFSDYFTEPDKARDGYQQIFAKGFVADSPLTIRHNLRDVLYNASVYRDEKGKVLEELTEMKGKSMVTVDSLTNGQGDIALIKQVLVNLISNAFKYSTKKEKPMIEIGCYNDDGEVQYYIKDNGVGFDMEYSNKLFGVFQRLHDPQEYHGTGVGLAIL